MKNFTLLTIAVVLLGAMTLNAQEAKVTYTDDFSTDINYQTLDFKTKPSTVIWHGLEFNSGSFDPQDVTVHAAKVADGGLLLQTSAGDWERDEDDGIYLFRYVNANTDFDAQVKLTGGHFATFNDSIVTYYNGAGILCRSTDHLKANFIYFHYFDVKAWNIHSILKSSVSGTQAETVVPMASYPVKDFPYTRLSKVGTKFTAYVSKDGKEWAEAASVDRPDFDGMDMQVGLAQCDFRSKADADAMAAEGVLPSAIFDEFKLTHDESGIPSAVASSELNLNTKAYFSRNTSSIKVESLKSDISGLKLYSIDGKLISSVKNVKNSNYSLPVSKNGIYMVEIQTTKGNKIHKVCVN
jgi:hypothetical protein